MYKACIFDLDGTLVDTLNSIAYFANSALKKCGYKEIEAQEYRYLVGNGADLLMRRMLNTVRGEGQYTEDEVMNLRATYDRLYESDPTNMVINYDGMADTVAALRQKGVKLAVLSNKPHNCTSAIVSALFRPGTFEACYGQRPDVARKPSPEGALQIAKELKVAPGECLYIGDTNTDMKTGAAAGMDTAGVLWGFRTRRELEENHANYILENPKEIEEIVANSMR